MIDTKQILATRESRFLEILESLFQYHKTRCWFTFTYDKASETIAYGDEPEEVISNREMIKLFDADRYSNTCLCKNCGLEIAYDFFPDTTSQRVKSIHIKLKM